MDNNTERQGVAYAEFRALAYGWMFREQPINDVGIDAQMEMTAESGEIRQLLALQIKSGTSYFKEKKNNCVIFRGINERHYKYWTRSPLPCILVLYNPEDDMCIWERLTEETIERTKGGEGYLLRVPMHQKFLDDDSNRDLLAYTHLPQNITNYNFLLSQKMFMQILADGGEIKVRAEERIDKVCGSENVELIVDDGKTIKKYSYPYSFPYASFSDVLPRLFPWADFEADEDYYEENDIDLWREYGCKFDTVDREWIECIPFKEFRKSLDPMRCINHFGMIDEYMLKLKLNDLGKAFLKIDDFVSQDQPYVLTRPEEVEEE